MSCTMGGKLDWKRARRVIPNVWHVGKVFARWLAERDPVDRDGTRRTKS